ncbi:MAG: DEAD/DEAH box helicase, partial [Methyloglobulus sp.]|nr:DEAD/DEAH box helicase [Methyloglobulus sp.]
TLGSENVHIIDPFTGTGTFITRLLQSGLIGKEQLPYKYQNEIHANEIVLLAYYIAAINIEAVYHSILGGDYQPFNGICLTDTFQLHEKEDLVSMVLEANSSRRKKQKALDIRVIIGNPPYSAGQNSANDNNANIAYPKLDDSIRNSYAAHSTATNKNALYDSYIRAIRWASDRIGNSGVIGFITNAGFVDANTADGLRKCLADEFSSIYVLHLRGSIRGKSGDSAKKEGKNVFNIMTGVAVTLFVKNPSAAERNKIYFHDIGDYLSREDKLAKIRAFKSLDGITQINGWLPITPDKHHDWINQREDSFGEYISLGDKKEKDSVTIFENYSSGLKTQRDAWCYNFSRNGLAQNIKNTISFYNQEIKRFENEKRDGKKPEKNLDNAKISWSANLDSGLIKGRKLTFTDNAAIQSIYRPFTKQWLYYSRDLNERVYQMPRIFPDATVENRVIMIKQRWGGDGQLALMVSCVPELQTNGGTQCFPLKLYEKASGYAESTETDNSQDDLFTNSKPNEHAQSNAEYTVKDGLTNEGLAHFQSAYPAETITKEDVFYYIYGLLHSNDYKSRYADNFNKELPRIPCMKKAADFWAFSKAGRSLAELHINYETVDAYLVNYAGGSLFMDSYEDKDYRVEQMKFAKKGKETDKTTVIYNHKITMTGIPLEAYEYVVNGKPALEWVMERQAVTTHKESGIVNDANLWAIETMHDAAYPLKLFQRVITVSLETMKIVKAMPRLDIVVGESKEQEKMGLNK